MADVVFVFVRGPNREVYGGEISTITTAESIAARGHQAAFLVTAEDELSRELDRRHFSYEIVPVLDPFIGLRKAGLRGGLRRIAAIARVNAAAFRWARGRRSAIVHAAQVNGFLAVAFGAKLAGAKAIYHVRCTNGDKPTSLIEALSIVLSDRTITVSRSLRDFMIDTAPAFVRRLLAKRMEAIYNGFDFADMDRFRAANPRDACRAKLGIAGDELLLLLVGGIDPTKGQLPFLERAFAGVLAAVPKLRLVLVGGTEDPAFGAACRAAAAPFGDRVTFTGYLPREAVYRHYQAADILVLPSSREGLPRCAIEGAGFALPIVATAITGTIETVRDGETGYLVPLERIEEMTGHLVALARDLTLRARLGAAGAAYVRGEFGRERNAAEIDRVYRELVS